MTGKALAGALLATFLTASAASAIDVKTSHKVGTDFSALRTYSWSTNPKLGPSHPLAEGTALDREIRQVADQTLAGAGFERVARDADLEVSYVGYVFEKLTIEGERSSLGEGVAWIGDPRAHSTRTYEEGTLVFEIRSADSGELLWSGWASEVARTPDKLRKKAPAGARKILRHFPPEPR